MFASHWRFLYQKPEGPGRNRQGHGEGEAMRAFLIPCVAFCSLALSGCSVVYSVHPLATKDDAVDEPLLVGQWKHSGDGDSSMCIQKGDHGTYTMIIADDDAKSESDPKPASDPNAEKPSKLVETYQVTLVQLEDKLFADMVAGDLAVDGTKVDLPVGAVKRHSIVKLNVTDSDLTYTVLRTSAIREAKEQGYAPLDFVEIDDGLLLTSSTEDLRFSVSHFADRLFEEDEDHFTRVIDNGAVGSSHPCPAITPP